MGCRYEEVCNHVILLKCCTLNATATTLLGAVQSSLGALDVSVSRQGYHDWFHCNQVFVSYIIFVSHDCGATLVTELVNDFSKLFTHNAALAS